MALVLVICYESLRRILRRLSVAYPVAKKPDWLTAEIVRERLTYDPDTGVFRWKHPSGRGWRYPRGTVAGCTDGEGYLRIGLGGSGKHLSAAHLAWLYMTGEWPTDQLDHKNRVRSDCSWNNLRVVTQSQNKANSGFYANNTSGYRGVVKHGAGWRAQITVNGHCQRIGHFATPEEASWAYQRARLQYFGSMSEEFA